MSELLYAASGSCTFSLTFSICLLVRIHCFRQQGKQDMALTVLCRGECSIKITFLYNEHYNSFFFFFLLAQIYPEIHENCQLDEPKIIQMAVVVMVVVVGEAQARKQGRHISGMFQFISQGILS